MAAGKAAGKAVQRNSGDDFAKITWYGLLGLTAYVTCGLPLMV
jgi:hypothetical protein